LLYIWLQNTIGDKLELKKEVRNQLYLREN